MTPPRPTPRQRFVEAMREVKTPGPASCTCRECKALRQAAEAFADAECAPHTKDHPGEWKEMATGHDHTTCFADILKEMFGE